MERSFAPSERSDWLSGRTPKLIATLIVIALGLSTTAAAGQSVHRIDEIHFDDIHPGRGGARRVELHLRPLTRLGEPVHDLDPNNITINDGGERVDSADVEIRTLAASGVGITSVIAIDVSRTMRGEPFERARSAALEFVRLLDPRDRVAIVTFADEVRVPVEFSDSRSEAIRALELLEAEERSLTKVLYDALHKSLEMIRMGSDLPRRAFILVSSDGKDIGSLRGIRQVIKLGQSNRLQPPVLVFAIGYSRFGGDGLPVLERLSNEIGGEFIRAESPLQIPTFFDSTRRQMRDGLIVSYPGNLDGKEHTVEIIVDGIHSTRRAIYSNIRPSLLPWKLAGAVIFLLLAAGILRARRRPRGRLIFVSGPLAGRAIVLTSMRTRIGALPENDIVLVSDLVSRYHATIMSRGPYAEIQDLDSSNGTYLNGTRISDSPLEHGDRIRFADIEAIFER